MDGPRPLPDPGDEHKVPTVALQGCPSRDSHHPHPQPIPGGPGPISQEILTKGLACLTTKWTLSYRSKSLPRPYHCSSPGSPGPDDQGIQSHWVSRPFPEGPLLAGTWSCCSGQGAKRTRGTRVGVVHDPKAPPHSTTDGIPCWLQRERVSRLLSSPYGPGR